MTVAPVVIQANIEGIQRNAQKSIAAPGFGDQLMSFLSNANNKMNAADVVTESFAAGETNNIHETVLAAEQAVITFSLVSSVRNRALEAYNEVMRMSI